MKPTLLIASQNAHKIAELQPLLERAGFAVTDARTHVLPEPVEDSGTFIGNARIKAKAAVEATGMAVLADDSGIIVDALGDFPGVEAAPYAKSLGGYPQAVEDLLKRLDGRPAHCYYFCVLLLLFPNGEEIIATGRVNGMLIRDRRGENDFGYDPWVQIEGRNETFAEISSEEKNRLSHRGLALQDLLQQLKGRHDLRAVS
jgi:XTP/dITP diphosphohydrolase